MKRNVAFKKYGYMLQYLSCIILYILYIFIYFIGAKGADRGIDTEIVIDRVVREDPFQDRQVKI